MPPPTTHATRAPAGPDNQGGAVQTVHLQLQSACVWCGRGAGARRKPSLQGRHTGRPCRERDCRCMFAHLNTPPSASPATAGPENKSAPSRQRPPAPAPAPAPAATECPAAATAGPGNRLAPCRQRACSCRVLASGAAGVPPPAAAATAGPVCASPASAAAAA